MIIHRARTELKSTLGPLYDSLKAQSSRTIAALQDSILTLQAANAHAYEAGYQAAYAGYRDLSGRYVAELKKPRIRLGSAIGMRGAAGVGLVVGRAVR